MSIQDELAAATGFDWDPGNRNKNWLGHSVTTTECEQIFFNEPLVVASDSKHSQAEDRYYALGRTSAHRRLFVVFTMRGTLVRVISARDMSRKERRVYATYFAQ
jgi:uncharacterized DUF497 family protein